jgi:iron complex outermembrane receptor protein
MKIDPSQVLVDPRGNGAHTHSDLMSGHLEYRFNESLAATYVYGHGLYDSANFGPSLNQPEVLVNGDATARQPGTNIPSLQFASNPFTDQESTSHELRVDGKVGGVTWRVGYYHSKVEDLGALALLERRLPLAFDPGGQVFFAATPLAATLSTFTDETEAEFGSVSVPIGSSWTLDAEARTSKEKRKQLPLNRTRDFSEFTPRVNLKWQPQAGWMFYASAAKGTKAGGFNGVTADVATFDPEENTTYELGGKQSLLEGRLQLNYAVFMIDWKNLQLSVPDTIQSRPPVQDPNYIGNVSGAKAKGFEVEAFMAATDHVRINFAGSYVKSTFNGDVIDTTYGRLCETNGTAVCVFLPRNAVSLPLGGSPIGGKDLPRTPKSKVSLGLEYTLPVAAYELSLRGDANYQSKYYIENLNLAYIPSRTLLNVNVALSDPDGRWTASLWGKNMTDEVYASSAFAVSVINQYGPALGLGRTMGVTLRYNF